MEQTRRTPRYPFVAPAEVIPEHTGISLPSEVKELSLYGCYLDTPSPLPTRTRVVVKIYGGDEFFEATATVIYSNPTLGMGLVFRDVKPGYMEVLRRWLLAAMQSGQEERPQRDGGAEEHRGSERGKASEEDGSPEKADDANGSA